MQEKKSNSCVSFDVAAAACNAGGVSIFRRLTKEGKEQNVMISPASIEMALAMTMAGARGKTLTEMQRVLCCTSEHTNESFQMLSGKFAPPPSSKETPTVGEGKNDDKPAILSVANSIWGDHFDPRFKTLVRDCFQAGAFPWSTAAVINKWCAEATRNRIPSLLAEDPPADGGLVLVNAVYFKAAWLRAFNERYTRDAAFTLLDGKEMQVKMMVGDRKGKYRYYETNEAQLIDLPYAGGEFVATVVLPRASSEATVSDDRETNPVGARNPTATSMSTLTGRILSPATWREWRCKLDQCPETMRGTLHLPRFKSEFRCDLAVPLQAMGMQQAFSDMAEFPGISGTHPMKIKSVVHKTFVEVTEQGTEAAAATAVVMTKCLSFKDEPQEPNFSMICDHPFLFAIQHRQTGVLLFLGKIDAPSV